MTAIPVEELAKAFITSHAKTSPGTDFVLDSGVRNSLVRWCDETAKSAQDEIVDHGA